MKNLLKLYESYIGFAHSFSARKDVFFLNPWQEERYWQQLEATFNIHYANLGIDAWLNYYPGTWMPIDYIEEIEKRKATDLRKKRGDDKWGLEIGIRYFPKKEYYPPVFIHELITFDRELSMQRMLVRKKLKFRYLHMFELSLAGYSELLQKKHENQYKHWLYNNLDEYNSLQRFEHYGVSWTGVSKLVKKGSFKETLKYSAQIDSKILNIKYKTRRYVRWQLLKLQRTGYMSEKLNKITFFTTFIKFLIDVVTGRIRLKK